MSAALVILWGIVAAIEIILVSQPGGVGSQIALSASIIAILLVMRLFRFDVRMRHVFLALGSVVVLRYAYWRTTSTLPPMTDLWSFVPGVLLYCAEMYSIVMLGISLFVVSDPKERKTTPKIDPDTAPRVDVLVPSYNESSDILALTLSAAKAMVYPADKLTVTLLDDGATAEKLNSPNRATAAAARLRAAELKALCKKLGVGYHARERNVHAKAGNLNGGLSVTTGDLVVVFDADHAPERNFLTETVGYFAQDPKLFLVQTPHFFVNPDPVERNLGTFDHMPSENEMFYGRIQSGLDRWNAAFFCGSAAVLRRKALEEAGGFAGITVTEDAETALELHAKGWNSVYVDKPLVVGLQPETFSSLIGQRARWCSGMVQILLLKNPLLKRGLSFAQRIGYLSSSLFWLFPFARLAFFVAPLLFILFNLKIYVSSMEEFFAYALTYLIASEVIRASLYGKLRWPWISELYEYAQSVFLLPAIASVVVSPRKPTFNVTAKGDDVREDRLSELALPYFVIFLVSLLGMAVCIYRWQTEPEISGLLAVAGVWQFINLLIAGAGLGIVTERAERRGANRLASSAQIDLMIGSERYAAQLEDVSAAGASVRFLDVIPPSLREHQPAVVHLVEAPDGLADAKLPVTMLDISETGDRVGIAFKLEAQDYPILAELMLSDMSTVRAQREQRRKYRGIVHGTFDLVIWALTAPLTFFVLLFKGDKEPEPAVENEPIKATPRRARTGALKTKVDVA
jgi:cellulose synthase (UDP-forming)